jgi:hypothetical protein
MLQTDGYRALAVKIACNVHLRSLNNKDFNARYPAVGADGLIAGSLGHFDEADYRRQLEQGAGTAQRSST